MKRALFSAGLFLAASAALGQTILQPGDWPGGRFSPKAVAAVVSAFSAGGIWLDGINGDTTGTHSGGWKTTSALLASGGGPIANGGKGIISFWTMCEAYDTAIGTEPRCVGSDIMNHISQLTSGTSSESVNGINVVIDTASVTPNSGCGTFRFNSNSSTEPFASAPQFGLAATNAFCSSDLGKPTHWLIVWDHSTSTFCGQIYKNGVSLNVAQPSGTGFSANYANAAGFSIGNNEKFGTANTAFNSANYQGMLAEVFIDLAPASTPCVSGAIANYTVSKFYNISTGNPVNLGVNCSTPTGSQPTMCFRFNGATTITNEGYGGTFTTRNATNVSVAPKGPGQTPVGPYLKYIALGDAGSTTTTVTPNFNHYTPVAGDLILVFGGARWGASGSRAITLGTANGFATFGSPSGVTGFEVINQFYKVAVGGDSLPVLTVNSTPGANPTYAVMVYGGANASTPLSGRIGTWTTATTTPVSCSFGATPQSNTTIVSVGYSWGGNYANQTLTQTGAQRRFWSPDNSTSSPSMLFNDYVNSGTTAVPNATMTTGTSDDDGCMIFEIKP
jgi:hypothetical protein